MLIGYARTSTDRQVHDLQIDALKAAGAERIFVETISGAARDRPVLAQALSFLRRGDTLLIWRLDRLARSVRQLTETVADLEARGVQLRSLTEALDTSTPTGRLTFHLFAAIGQFERELTVERVKAGLQAARARGRVGGRPRAMDAAKVRTAKALLAAHEMTCAQIAETLGVSLTTLYRNVPGARAGAESGIWAAPKSRRIPPALAGDLTENRKVSQA